MIGIAFIAASALFHEFSTSLGKYETLHKKESIYAFGFLNAFAMIVIFIASSFIFGYEFTFSAASLPTFIVRMILETILVFISLHAILKADRSTCSFLRIITIPLLLVIEFGMGITPTVQQLLGIGIILVVIALLVLNHGLSRNGKLLALSSATLAAGTISLYKYNITHFNSVAAEQVAGLLVIIFVLIIAARVKKHENVFSYLAKPIFLAQSVTFGVGGVLGSFAYLYAPASIITTAVRAFEVLTAILVGRVYFHEKHLWLKLVACAAIVGGIVLTIP